MSASYFCQPQYSRLVLNQQVGDFEIQEGHLTATSHQSTQSNSSLPLASTPTFADLDHGKQNPLICFENQLIFPGDTHISSAF